METAAANITRVSLELGGKSANVVFDDADLDVAIPKSLWSVFDNAGQDCCARSRQFVQRPIYDEFVERFSKATEAIGVGDPLDETTEMGPLISQGQRQTALDYLAIGQEEGGRLTTGGEQLDREGFYLTPPCSPTSTTPGAWPARRSSARSCASCRSTPRKRRSVSRTTRRTGSPARSGPGHRARDPGGQGDPHRRHQRELLEQRVHRGAVRGLQAERDRPRDGDARSRALHRGEEHLLQRGVRVLTPSGRSGRVPSR